MKKTAFYISTCILSFGLFLNHPTSSNAEETSTQIVTTQEAQTKAETYLKNISKRSYPEWKDAYFSENTILYDLEGSIKGYLFQVKKDDKNLGYIIANSNQNQPSIIESTREGSNPYTTVKEGKTIYTGLLQQSTQENKNKYNIEEIKKHVNVEENKQNVSKNTFYASLKAESISDNEKRKIINDVPDYQWYRGCSPTSIANIISYWDKHGYNNLVKDNETTNTLIDNIGNDVKTNEKGSTLIRNYMPGIRKYWNERGYYPKIVTDDKPTYDKYIKEIDANRPILISLQNHPFYENHAIAGVGYQQFYIPELNEDFKDIILRDTWPGTPIDTYYSFNESSKYIFGYTIINPAAKGWVTDFNEKWRYIENSGTLKTGWFQDNGNWYYLDPSGIMKTEWIEDKGNWYYLDPSGGAMKTGWVEIKGNWYYLDPSGIMKTGWFQSNGKWYYLDTKPGNNQGVMLKGWQLIDNKWYYLDLYNGDMVEPGIQIINGKWYLIDKSGAMLVGGWQSFEGNWYYLNEDGSMVSGWKQNNGKWYYFNPFGKMVTDSYYIDGKVYYFNSDGTLIE
ncbi:C39 family peptidase [Bacillus pseudomycoides]|uniref:C39 family peptidase n=1 Tax=Bacillus pseudomycoides TaxID=64104 RepID=UPI000BF15C9A|nr:C39 family peptidase [Bacillus pseudomycoides]PEO52056.1 hypothetical protein CN559_04310 [Bacillus pseudomycoides]